MCIGAIGVALASLRFTITGPRTESSFVRLIQSHRLGAHFARAIRSCFGMAKWQVGLSSVKFKVARTIIVANPIPMMDNLLGRQRATENLLHYKAMLKDCLVIWLSSDDNIPITSLRTAHAPTPIRSGYPYRCCPVTLLTAILGTLTKCARKDLKFGSASSTCQCYLHVPIIHPMLIMDKV